MIMICASIEVCRNYYLIFTPHFFCKFYFAEKRGELTKYNVIRQAIDEAMQMCINYGQFKKIMLKKGYIINDDLVHILYIVHLITL